MTFTNVFLSIIFLLIIPLIIGFLVCEKLHIDYGFSNFFVMGWFSLWAVGQIILVPMVLRDVPFTWACIALLFVDIVMVVFSLYRIYRHMEHLGAKHLRSEFTCIRLDSSSLFFVALCFLVAFILYQNLMLQHTDADDSRFVVLAMDTVKSDRMLRTNPINGEYFTQWLGEVEKDFSSPWPVYVAFLSSICGVKATVMFHTLFPFALYILITCCFWIVGDTLFKGDFDSKCIFTIFIWCIFIFGNYSVKSAETFTMSRVWQGKAIVAGAGIPMMTCIMAKLYEKITSLILLQMIIIDLALCLLSGMGIVIGAILMMSFGVVYTVIKKDIRYMICPALISLINCVYYLINQNAVNFI